MGFWPLQGILRLVFRLFSLMLGKLCIRLNNRKTSLTFPCLGLYPISDSIDLVNELFCWTMIEAPFLVEQHARKRCFFFILFVCFYLLTYGTSTHNNRSSCRQSKYLNKPLILHKQYAYIEPQPDSNCRGEKKLCRKDHHWSR